MLKDNDPLDLKGPPSIDEALETMSKFCDRYNIAETKLSRLATGNATVPYYLRKGRDMRISTIDKLYKWMREYEELI